MNQHPILTTDLSFIFFICNKKASRERDDTIIFISCIIDHIMIINESMNMNIF